MPHISHTLDFFDYLGIISLICLSSAVTIASLWRPKKMSPRYRTLLMLASRDPSKKPISALHPNLPSAKAWAQAIFEGMEEKDKQGALIRVFVTEEKHVMDLEPVKPVETKK